MFLKRGQSWEPKQNTGLPSSLASDLRSILGVLGQTQRTNIDDGPSFVLTLFRHYCALVPDRIPLRPADRFMEYSRLTGEMRV